MARSRRTPAMLVGRCSSQLSGHSLQGKLKSHSLRAKPRDLQFCKLVVEMFFEEAVWALRPVGPGTDQPSVLPARQGIRVTDSPTLSERRRRGTLSPQPVSVLRQKTFPGRACRTAESLGFAPGDDKGAGLKPRSLLRLSGRLKSALVQSMTAGPSTSLRSGRDDNSYLEYGMRVPKNNCDCDKKSQTG